jgi:hypothetical protein
MCQLEELTDGRRPRREDRENSKTLWLVALLDDGSVKARGQRNEEPIRDKEGSEQRPVRGSRCYDDQ